MTLTMTRHDHSSHCDIYACGAGDHAPKIGEVVAAARVREGKRLDQNQILNS